MLIPQPLLRSPLLRLHLPSPFQSSLSLKPSPILQFIRPKLTINQILRGGRIPPKHKRKAKSEGPDLKSNPFKKAVVQKVYIVKPKVPHSLGSWC
jgi:hypothetical protein